MSGCLPDLKIDNISLYTVPATWMICIIPRYYRGLLYRNETKHLPDIRAPRSFANAVRGDPDLPSDVKNRICRAEAAQANGLENLGLFAAAVVAGNLARLPTKLLNGLTIGYCISRVVYNFVYINNDTQARAVMRGCTYNFGMGIVMTLFIMAGNILRTI